ncbi:MAG: sel1 repeat family protein [Clostridia bacterium]|nr:sel1 repeat family protein [Clostridia bacterium]
MYDNAKAITAYLHGDREGAAAMFLEGAREGDIFGAFNYAWCLWRGVGVSPDAKAARSFFGFASELSGGDAHYNLAILHMHGEGGRVDYRKAFSHMQTAAELGCVEAMLYLGNAYTTGTLFEPDIIGISRIPFHTAEYRSSAFYLEGSVEDAQADEEARVRIVSADASEAFYWFSRAAHHDPTYAEALVAKGQFLYAKCYLDGFGTEYNRERGLKIMLLAGANGSPEAAGFLAEQGVPMALLEDVRKKRRQ